MSDLYEDEMTPGERHNQWLMERARRENQHMHFFEGVISTIDCKLEDCPDQRCRAMRRPLLRRTLACPDCGEPQPSGLTDEVEWRHYCYAKVRGEVIQ